MKRFLSFLVLFLLILSPAWASVSPSISASAVTAHTDISMSYLGMLFGTVGHTINGVSGQMLGKLFYKFNEGLFCAAGVMIAYSSFLTVFRGAGEGKWDSQKSPAFYVMLRIVFGIVLIVPSASTGYNLAQDLMMRVVVSGVKLADMTWSYGLQYLNSGGSLFYAPRNLKGSTEAVGGGQIIPDSDFQNFLQKAVYKSTDDSPSSLPSGVISQIFSNEVCMYEQNMSQNSLAAQSSNGEQSYNSGYSSGALKPKLSGDYYHFGSKCGSFHWSALTKKVGQTPVPTTCQIQGTGSDGSNSSVAPTTICPFNFQAAEAIVSNLMPVARDYACSVMPGDNKPSYCDDSNNLTTSEIQNRTSQGMFSAMIAYMNALHPIQAHSVITANTNKRSFIAGASSEGWASAGKYYWDLEKLTTQSESASNMSNFVQTSSVTTTKFSPGPPPASFFGNVVSSNDLSVIKLYQNYRGATQKGGNHTPGWLVFALSASGLLSMLAKVVPILGVILTFGKLAVVMSGGPTSNDPILFLHILGNIMIDGAGNIFISGVLWSLITNTIDSMPCFQPLKGINAAMVDWIKPVLFFAALAFLGQGFLYCYYIPLYPYFIYSFAVLGWLAIVIEAMLAAPLVALGVTHPEGHDFLGRAEQALMLAVSVFIRPALLVIGYFAAMLLSYVSLRYIIYSFSYVAGGSNFYLGLGDSGFLISLFVVFPLFYSLFAIVVYQVITQSYALIFSLPDYVMRWVGVSQQTSFFNPEKMTGAVQSGFTQSVQKGSQLAQQAIQYHANRKPDATSANMTFRR